MTIEIYALVHGKYHDDKRYLCSVFCDSIVYTNCLDEAWFVAQVNGRGVLSGEVSHLHGKGNNTSEFVCDLR